MGSGKPYTERIGEKHNMLTILKITGKEDVGKRTKIRCLVRCECGQEKDVRIESVVNGKQYSCGCNRKKNENSAQRKMFNNYKNSAINRGYSFDLTEQQFVSISTSNCHYCGIEPSNSKETYGDTFVLNGIDRKNNTIGYVFDNCLPCCSICNRAKLDMPYDDFVAWTRRFKNA